MNKRAPDVGARSDATAETAPTGQSKPLDLSTIDADSLSDDMRFLVRMSKARRYLDWIYRSMRPYLGERVLEIGPGIGLLTSLLVSNREVSALEIDSKAEEVLSRRFGAISNFQLIKGAVERDEWIDDQTTGRYDTVVCVNVLEHIVDDLAALENMRKSLRPGGCLFLFVPALMAIYGTLDTAVGHQRRYSLDEVRTKVRAAGFDIDEIKYANLLGAPAWFWSSRVTKRSMPNASILTLFDRFVPIWTWIESRIRVPFGMTVICVARKN